MTKRPFRHPIRLNLSAIFGVRYTDFRGLPSGLLLRKVLSLENNRATKNSTRCPLRPPCAPTIGQRNNYCKTITNALLSCVPPGLFGGGVLMYFSFLRWLFLVNVVIFVLVFFFATTPRLAFPDDTATPNWTKYNTSDVTSQNIERADKCSVRYVVDEPDNPSDIQPFIDFLLGTVCMEITVMEQA